eukprot:gene2317-4509_t
MNALSTALLLKKMNCLICFCESGFATVSLNICDLNFVKLKTVSKIFKTTLVYNFEDSIVYNGNWYKVFSKTLFSKFSELTKSLYDIIINAENSPLKKTLTAFDLVLLVGMGSLIGAGIFVLTELLVLLNMLIRLNGEFVARPVGWVLMLEYGLSSATVASGWSGYMVGILDSGGVHLPKYLSTTPLDGGLVSLPAVFIALFIGQLLVRWVRESAG